MITGRISCAILIALVVDVSTGRAADIVGTVRVQPKLSEEDYQKQMKNVKRDDIYKTQGAQRVDYKTASANVVVYVEEAQGEFKAPESNPRIVQKNASFDPPILAVMVGTTVDFPNNDAIFHNVFSYSKVKPFDLGLYKSGASKSVTFTRTGQVTMYCSIHRTMKADILILQNPYFTLTDGKGLYKISGVPEGAYRIVAWHERFPEAMQDVTIPKDVPEVRADLTLGVLNLPAVE